MTEETTLAALHDVQRYIIQMDTWTTGHAATLAE